jgi:c-di-GMP-binding flagellar brake protein YcgR
MIDDLESMLQVGLVVSFDAMPAHKEAPRFRSAVYGWQPGAALLLARPMADGKLISLWHNQNCAVRFLSNGYACGFVTQVIDWDSKEDPMVRVKWPDAVEKVCFRRFERIVVQTPCKITVANNTYDGSFSDLSAGGCRLRTDAELAKNMMVDLSFTLPDGYFFEKVSGVVCNERRHASDTVAGIQFMTNQDHIVSDIAFFVTTTLERSGRRHTAQQRALIIDEQVGASDDIKKALEEQEFETTAAVGLVDGFYRLRVAPPNVLILSARHKTPNPLDICAIAWRANGFENLPILIYDAEEEGSTLLEGKTIIAFEKDCNPMRIAAMALRQVREARS